jgi:hypothetical protein
VDLLERVSREGLWRKGSVEGVGMRDGDGLDRFDG